MTGRSKRASFWSIKRKQRREQQQPPRLPLRLALALWPSFRLLGQTTHFHFPIVSTQTGRQADVLF